MIHESEKLAVIKAAREWAKAERRLRDASSIYDLAYPSRTHEAYREWASKESDRAEEELLTAAKRLEEAEHPPQKIVTFFGKQIKVGDPIDEMLFTWLEGEAKRVMSRRWW